MSKPDRYIHINNISNIIITKARRRGMSYNWYETYKSYFTYSGIPKFLPRKLKKKYKLKHKLK